MSQIAREHPNEPDRWFGDPGSVAIAHDELPDLDRDDLPEDDEEYEGP